jgi:hypothetical protein
VGTPLGANERLIGGGTLEENIIIIIIVINNILRKRRNNSAVARQQGAARCYKCINNAPSNNAYCTVANDMELSASAALLLPAYFKCLNGSVEHPKTFNGPACKACLQECGSKGAAAAATCFACAARVPGGGGALCGACHCGVGKMRASNAGKCEACAAKLQPAKIVGSSALAGHACMRAV